ncbi:hypothetical protein HK103_005047 [Boothiomyces macroporosus]|uniref:Profilin n=1 Tax=Boothiomyces macroporosus TaxID=261099 RepID=A0AAD5UJZ9_9FUNG|nr:hypothetical protein HK103_005047 [Boothiomyces macroporosus]
MSWQNYIDDLIKKGFTHAAIHDQENYSVAYSPSFNITRDEVFGIQAAFSKGGNITVSGKNYSVTKSLDVLYAPNLIIHKTKRYFAIGVYDKISESDATRFMKDLADYFNSVGY